MQPYARPYPWFSLCGLNCGLCPQHQTKAASRCPGCGGEDFHLKHPTCPIVTCSRKHGDPVFCFACASYPCGRYTSGNEKDSFISYRHVSEDMERVRREGLDAYRAVLEEKIILLEQLLESYDDGRSKSFLCNAVNQLPLEVVRRVAESMAASDVLDGEGTESAEAPAIRKASAARLRGLLEAEATRLEIPLTMRK